MDKLAEMTTHERDVFKKNAFLNLQKALLDEQYEQCNYWIFCATLCGAEAHELSQLLENPAMECAAA